jgi:hypothetical protein
VRNYCGGDGAPIDGPIGHDERATGPAFCFDVVSQH